MFFLTWVESIENRNAKRRRMKMGSAAKGSTAKLKSESNISNSSYQPHNFNKNLTMKSKTKVTWSGIFFYANVMNPSHWVNIQTRTHYTKLIQSRFHNVWSVANKAITLKKSEKSFYTDDVLYPWGVNGDATFHIVDWFPKLYWEFVLGLFWKKSWFSDLKLTFR